MDIDGDPVTLPCEVCGASIPVRRFDAEWESWRVEYRPQTYRSLFSRIRRVR
jgi:hypothetical protein